jgi:hypothetical protein
VVLKRRYKSVVLMLADISVCSGQPSEMQILHPTNLLLLFVLMNALIGVLARQFITKPFPDLYEVSVEELQHGLDAGQFTSVDLIKVSIPHHIHRQFWYSDTVVGLFRPYRRSKPQRSSFAGGDRVESLNSVSSCRVGS